MLRLASLSQTGEVCCLCPAVAGEEFLLAFQDAIKEICRLQELLCDHWVVNRPPAVQAVVIAHEGWRHLNAAVAGYAIEMMLIALIPASHAAVEPQTWLDCSRADQMIALTGKGLKRWVWELHVKRLGLHLKIYSFIEKLIARNMIGMPQMNGKICLRAIMIIIIMAIAVVSISCAQQHIPQHVLSQEIMAKISSGTPVYYDDAVIFGDLDLAGLPGAHVPVSFVFTNCTFANASFAAVTFDQDAIFWGTTFENARFDHASFLGSADFANATFGNVSFSSAAFARPAMFDGSLFLENISFEDAVFSEDASFNHARFLETANFNYSDFDSYSYFAYAQFSGDALFSDIDFSGPADFSNASFANQAVFFSSRMKAPCFSGCIFTGPARFGLTGFSGLTSFGDAVFEDEANFVLARFSDAAYFSGADFRSLALFGLTKFEDIVSFDGAKFSNDLNFKAASISTLLFERAKLEANSRIILNDTDFARFKAHWNAIEEYVVWLPGAYLALVENYRRLGWSVDEDDCYYRYRWLDQSDKSWGWSKIIDMLSWLSCGYGVRPSFAVFWSLLTILVFGLIFWMGDGIRRSAKPLSEPAMDGCFPERATLRNALFFSTMIFLSQGPIDFLPVGRHRYYVILEGILGWLLLALFLVTLGRVMIR